MHQERKQLLVFGYGLAVIMIVWSGLFWRKHPAAVWPWLLVVPAVALAAVTRWRLESLKPFYARWMKVAHMIGQVVTTALLTLIFYLVFAPVGIILRMLRKDLLDRAIEPQAPTYWKKKKAVADRDRYTKQF